MKTDKLKDIISNLGLEFEMDSNTSLLKVQCENGLYDLAIVNVGKRFVMFTSSIMKSHLSDFQQEILFKALTKYSGTPINKR